MKTLIKNATIVNEGVKSEADILIENDIIKSVIPRNGSHEYIDNPGADVIVDASGCVVLPGIIDTHVHFREPGLTHKATIESESRAAAYGGVTSYFEMPNTNPQTTDLEALEAKHTIAKRDSHVNYTFFFGATNDNSHLLPLLDHSFIPGIKLFMGSSTGNMLVDGEEALNTIFSMASELNLPIVAHCEDTSIIDANMLKMKAEYGDQEIPVAMHPLIRSAEACYASSSKAVALAKANSAHLHIAHLTTYHELSLIDGCENITAEVTPAHLIFTDADYATKGALIKCNPAVKTSADREALRKALNDGRITTIGTDHAPHLLSEKEGGAAKAVSGMPSLQYSLVSMLSLVDEGVMTIERMVELMCHNPARLFNVEYRGFIREGYKADLVIAKKDQPWCLTKDDIQSKCHWSPFEGMPFNWKVVHTFCNGCHLLDNGIFNEEFRGEALTFKS